jgi:hypothetical protein
VHTPRGLSNLIPFDVQDLPEVLETEPNNATDKLNTVSIPVVINGRIGEAKDVDLFRFKSDKNQQLICEVIAQRFGSPLDALLSLSDTNGVVLQQNDDADGADARIQFDAKKDTEYVLALRDLNERGGENFAYRLSIRAPRPDFAVRFLPDTLRVHRGGSDKVRCEVTRQPGFSGEVRVTVLEAPSGVYAEPLVLSVNIPSSAMLVLSALNDAPLGTFPFKLEASGIIDGKTVTHAAQPLVNDRSVKEAFITILDAAPFSLDVLTLAAGIEQGQSGGVEVLAQRHEGFTGEIKLAAEGFSSGREAITRSFEVSQPTLKANESRATLNFKAKNDAEVGTRAVVIKGDAVENGQPVTQYSHPFPIIVTEIPFTLSSSLPRLIVTVLPPGAQSAAGEAAFQVRAARRAGFNGEIALTMEGLPEGINATIEKISANAGEANVKLVATEKAPFGTNTLTVIGTGLFNDRNYKQRSAGITLVVNPPEPAVTNAPTAAATTTDSAK